MALSSVSLPIEQLVEFDSGHCEYSRGCVEIMVLVGATGTGSLRPKSEGYSKHLFICSAWRRVGGSATIRDLVVVRLVEEDDDWHAEFPAYSIYRINVVLSTDETRAVVAGGVSGVAADNEFDAIAKELQQPVVISTSLFGELLLDRQISMFTGDSIWNGQEINVTFATDGTLKIGQGLEAAEALWADQVGWKRRIDEYAVRELLPIKNEHWLEEGEAPVTADEFKAKMYLGSIGFSEDGSFDFWHDDGDLFLGHAIQISGSIREGLFRAAIAG